MAPFNTFNPANVMFRKSPADTGKGMYTNGQQTPNPSNPTNSNVLQAGAIRPTGTGPFDSAYRQNLATYAGGLMSNPSGLLQFNPTDPNAFGAGPTQWQPNQLPSTLSQQALGGQPFNYNPSPASPPAQNPLQTAAPSNSDYWKFWLQQWSAPFDQTPQSY